jgi:predicted DNA-binding antitoxin AbrB/MazE fold protein
MTANLKAIYENGVLRLADPLSLPEGTQVDITVTSPDVADRASQKMEDQSWEALTRLLADCAIDTGIPDLAQQHDHYLYGIKKG